MVDSGTYTPEVIARRLKIAESLLGDAPPIQHWAQGLNELLKGYTGGTIWKGAEDAEKAGDLAVSKYRGGFFPGGGGDPGVPASPGPAAAGPAPVTAAPPAAPDMSPIVPRPVPTAPAGPPGGSAFGGLPGWAPDERPLGIDGPTPSTAPDSLDAQRPPPGAMVPAIAAALQRPAGGPAPSPSPPMPPGPMPAPAGPVAGGPAPNPMHAMIAAGLTNPSPQVRRMAGKLQDQAIAAQLSGDKATDEIKEYNLARQQGEKSNFTDWKANLKRAGATQVTIDQKQESAFNTKAGGLQAERFNDMVKGGQEAQTLVADVNNLRDIGTRITTGKTAQIAQALGPYAEALGLKIEGLDDLQAYQAIVSRLAPRMRVPGTGATSDFEMQTFLKGLPSLGNTPDGNELISKTLDMLQQHKIAAADIGSRALSGELKPADAERELRKLPDPLTLWKQSKKAAPTAPASAPSPDGAPTRAEIEAEMRRRKIPIPGVQ